MNLNVLLEAKLKTVNFGEKLEFFFWLKNLLKLLKIEVKASNDDYLSISFISDARDLYLFPPHCDSR
jgi:hypothetical protein